MTASLLFSRFQALLNVGLRGATLVLRFGLSFYIIKYLGLEAAGIYGLAVGAIGLMPAIIGWGLNYFVSRDIVGNEPAVALVKLKTRLIVSLLSLAAGSVVIVGAALLTGFPASGTHLLILVLLWLETLALDIHLPLIGLELASVANLLVFIRFASWIPFVAALGYFATEARSLDIVFGAWIAANFVALATLAFVLRKWPLAMAMRSKPDFAWLRKILTGSWLIYISDLGLVGLTYLDRYVVSFLLGLSATGIYTFFWSLTNALQTLILTSVVQLALPKLVKAHREGSPAQWRAILNREIVKTLAFSVIFSFAIFAASEVIIRFLGMSNLREHRDLFALLLLAATFRSLSDLMNIGLTSTGRDKSYAMTNIAGVFISLGLALVGGYLWSLVGVGVSALMTAIILFLTRFMELRKIKADQTTGSLTE